VTKIKFEHLVNNSPVHERKSLNITGLSVDIVHLTSTERSATDKWPGEHPVSEL
jgi:hypothetical protein